MRNRGVPYTTTLPPYLSAYLEGLREFTHLSASAQLAQIVAEHFEAKAAQLKTKTKERKS